MIALATVSVPLSPNLPESCVSIAAAMLSVPIGAGETSNPTKRIPASLAISSARPTICFPSCSIRFFNRLDAISIFGASTNASCTRSAACQPIPRLNPSSCQYAAGKNGVLGGQFIIAAKRRLPRPPSVFRAICCIAVAVFSVASHSICWSGVVNVADAKRVRL